MNRILHRCVRLRADERGVALPLAMLGLVAVSLLLATAVITSSSEIALSAAHQGATRGLYNADRALESFIARRSVLSVAASRLTRGNWSQLVDGERYFIATEELSRGTPFIAGTGNAERHDMWSLVASPASGRGRVVGTLLRVTRTRKPFELGIQAGITSGGNLTVGGSSAISDGRDATACDSTKKAEHAIQVSDSAGVTIEGSKVKVTGSVDTASWKKSEMINKLLGGMTLDTLAARYAQVKFGPGAWTTPQIQSWNTSLLPKSRADSTNWGCPKELLTDCALYAGSNVDYYPMVSIDAADADAAPDTVWLKGKHGQGTLIVLNGTLAIEGNFIFKGIVLVEQDIHIKGTAGGGSSVKIEGAVLALGENSTLADNVSGNAVITYNRCAMDAAQNFYQLAHIETADQIFNARTTSWFEVTR